MQRFTVFNDFVIKVNDYRIHFWGMRKKEVESRIEQC